MVRPNQIIKSTDTTLTFLMFARSNQQVKRRVLLLNFPGKAVRLILQDDIDNVIENVSIRTEGAVNRYNVTVNTDEI